MREKNTAPLQQAEAEDQVRLKPFMGMRPGVYLAILYICVLFLIPALPVMRKSGAAIVFSSEPSGAALRVDGIYRGTSPDSFFISKGIHTFEAVLPGFETEQVVLEIPGRVIGSLFFPVRYPLDITLKTNDAAAAFAHTAADFAAWSFGGEPTATWQIPLSLSEGAYRIGHEYEPPVTEILEAAASFTVTRAALRDIVRAKILLDNGGLSPSPAGIFVSVQDMLLFLSQNPGSAQWLSGLLPSESASVIRTSNWYKNTSAAVQEPSAAPAGRFEAGGLSFTAFSAGSNAVPFGGLKNFMISENQVPSELFETFLNENPAWRDDTDLFSDEISRGREITGISWFAANAFCQWFTRRLPASMADREVRLPTEAEWEYAYRSGALNSMGNGWEWCADPFVPLPFIKTSPKAAGVIGSPERTLRGGPETRASLPPEFSSPFVSFRPVITDKDHE